MGILHAVLSIMYCEDQTIGDEAEEGTTEGNLFARLSEFGLLKEETLDAPLGDKTIVDVIALFVAQKYLRKHKPVLNAVQRAEGQDQEQRYYVGDRTRIEIVEPNGTKVGAPQRLKDFVWRVAKGDPDAMAPTEEPGGTQSQQ